MASLLNPNRPPAFCPGCSHERSLHALDRALSQLGLPPNEVVIVSDIGCSGLFDTFFGTHALHGLHGRALTYAAGIKLARPHLKVVVTMGDGGLGIGGAHFLAACRRNLDITLLILNNFNFGMTGGQFSCTTPHEASVASGFLNAIEKAMDICTVAAAAGAPFVARSSVYRKDLSKLLADAMTFEGFSVVDVWGLCTGHYLKRNVLTPKEIEKGINELPSFDGRVITNVRDEYGKSYRENIRRARDPGPQWKGMEAIFATPVAKRREVVLLGAAGDRIISAGSLLAYGAILGGMRVTQKNDYDITVMRGPSISELIISTEPIEYTGVERPDIVVALSKEGVTRRRDLFSRIPADGRIIVQEGVDIPPTAARIREVDFKGHGIKKQDRAIAALSLLAGAQDPITCDMLESAFRNAFSGKPLEAALEILERAASIP